MVVIDLEKQELAFKDEVEKQPLHTKRQRSRRAKIWIRLSISILFLVGIYNVLDRRKHKHDIVDDLEQSHPFPESGSGFTLLDSVLNQSKAEELFLTIPNAKSALKASRDYATHPHLAGAPEDFEDAKVILELFQTQFMIPVPREEPIFPAGSKSSRDATLKITNAKLPNAWVDVYYPVMNTALDRSLEILNSEGQSLWKADLEEDGDPLDPEAAKYKDAVPTWHGLSRDGEVTGQLVYANYGTKEDYDNLVATGVNVTGKIVITRYGGIFRGLKIKGAQELGAAGVLIYSDPRDDGSITVENGYKPYPGGPARNPTSVQRGSVQFLSIYPGDPTTPGYPAYENSTRTEGSNIPAIPSLPISWSNAERLLEELFEQGESLKVNGRASKRVVKLVNHVDTKVTPIWNTMAVIPGHINDEVVIIGNHRDAWVMGAADPTSGTVSVHEIIRGFGALLRSGWMPLRTILFASWDAEEYGLIGSTEWGEDFADWIQDHVVAYLNTDVSAVGSRFDVSGSPSLAHLIRQTAIDVPHPTQPNKTLWDARTDLGPYQGTWDDDLLATFTAAELRRDSFSTGVNPLGSGSDYTVFLQRLGVASTDEGFGSTPFDAPYHYHSIYDSQRWQELYADPGFHRHVAVAKHLGLMALRLVDSFILPLNTTQYSFELGEYLDLVEQIGSTFSIKPDVTTLRTSIAELKDASLALDKEKLAAEKDFRELLEKIIKKPTECSREPLLTVVVGMIRGWLDSLTFRPEPHHRPEHGCHGRGPRENRFEEHLSISSWFQADEPWEHDGHPPHHPPGGIENIPIHKFIRAAKRLQRANRMLMSFERGFISEGGIKDREWYRHLGVAPGKWLGYGATTLPALTEAITIDRNVTAAQYEAGRLHVLIDKLTKSLAVRSVE